MALWTPASRQQEKFFERTEDVVGIGGAGGGGKSECLRAKPLQQIEIHAQLYARGELPYSKGWTVYFRRTMPNLKQAIDRTRALYPGVDHAATFNTQDHMWTFPNAGGYKVQFAQLEDISAQYNHKSSEYSLLLFDELTEFEEEQYEYLQTRLRCADPSLHPQCCWASNPEGRGLKWVRDKFIKGKEFETTYINRTKLRDGRYIDKSQIFIPIKLQDNPALFESGQYEASLINRPAHIRRAILEGDWNINSNSFLGDDWEPTVHVCDNHPVPRGAFVFRSGDYGSRAPTSIDWWYKDSDGCLTAFHSLYVKNHTAVQVARRIKEVEQAYRLWNDEDDVSMLNNSVSVLDPSCFNNMGNQNTIAGDMKRFGVRFRPAKNDKINGIAQLIYRLTERIRDPVTGELTKPLIRWMKRCIAPIETIPQLPPDPNNPNFYDTNAEDHAADSARYACMANPLKLEREEQDTDDPDEEELTRDAPKGRSNIIGMGAWMKRSA